MGCNTTGGRRCEMVLSVNEELAEVKEFVWQEEGHQLVKSPPSCFTIRRPDWIKTTAHFFTSCFIFPTRHLHTKVRLCDLRLA